jgi:hypothetical protein
MIDYTKLTKAQIIEINEKLEEEILSLREGSESNKKLFDKEVVRLKGLLEKGEKEFTNLTLKKEELEERVNSLIEESFTKQRTISELNDKIIQKDKSIQELGNIKDATLKEIVQQKDEQIGFLSNQLNGLSDLFNEIFLGLKDQNALLGVYSRNINNFQERIDAKIAQFNTPPTEKK